jgi:hypothetical protein
MAAIVEAEEKTFDRINGWTGCGKRRTQAFA